MDGRRITSIARREELQEEWQKLKAKFNVEMRGRMIPTPRALRFKEEATAIQERIEELDRKDAERLALEKAPINDVLEIIAIPLLADVINDLVAGVDGMLLQQGCQQTIFSTYTQRIRSASLALIDTLAVAECGLPMLLDADDTLVDAVKKKLMSFIRQRLKIKDK